MKFSKTDKLLIEDLFKATEGLFIFTLYRRYTISPRELFEVITKFQEAGILKVEEDRLSLTKEGIDFATRKGINRKDNRSSKGKINIEFLGPQVEINSFYVPRNFEQ